MSRCWPRRSWCPCPLSLSHAGSNLTKEVIQQQSKGHRGSLSSAPPPFDLFRCRIPWPTCPLPCPLRRPLFFRLFFFFTCLALPPPLPPPSPVVALSGFRSPVPDNRSSSPTRVSGGTTPDSSSCLSCVLARESCLYLLSLCASVRVYPRIPSVLVVVCLCGVLCLCV